MVFLGRPDEAEPGVEGCPEGVAGTGEGVGQRHHAPRIRPYPCPIRPSGAPDSSQKTRFVPAHARFVTFFGMNLERLSGNGIKRVTDLSCLVTRPVNLAEDAHVS